MPTPILYQRALLLAKIETTSGTDASPVVGSNALLVRDPLYVPDIAQLDRNANVRTSLSPLATRPGRKTGKITFQHEVRNNGNLVGTTPPLLGTLLRACGYQQTQITGASGTIGTATAGGSNTGTISFAKTTAYAGTLPRTVTLTCTTLGGTGTAQVTVAAVAEGDLPAYSQTGVVVTNGTAITLPGSAQVTPTIGTSLAVGDVWTIILTPAGYEYTPISEAFETATLYLYYDGILHKMTAGVGTFSVEAPGGDYALFNFEFTGNYVAVTDAAMPDAEDYYEATAPQQVELANLKLNSETDLVASRFTIDAGNQIELRQDVNQSDAYAGARITGRTPTASFDPETTLEADFDFWAKLAAGTSMPFQARVGTAKGNVVRFICPATQIINMAYQNRTNIRAYDVSLNLSGADDELKVCFN